MTLPSQQGVCHTVTLPFTLKSILRQKKNYGNSNISPCKNIIFKKSSKRNQNPPRYYNSISSLKFQHKPKYYLSKFYKYNLQIFSRFFISLIFLNIHQIYLQGNKINLILKHLPALCNNDINIQEPNS